MCFTTVLRWMTDVIFVCFQAVAELAVVIYTALDFGLNDGEERNLSPGLENLLDLMTSIGEENVTISLQKFPQYRQGKTQLKFERVLFN